MVEVLVISLNRRSQVFFDHDLYLLKRKDRGRVLQHTEDLGELLGDNPLQIAQVLPQLKIDAPVLFAKLQNPVGDPVVNLSRHPDTSDRF